MPIKAENRARYPADWKQVRTRILERAGNCCEWCHVQNKARIARGKGDDEGLYMLDTADVYCADTGHHCGQRRMSDFDWGRMTDIVLTIAHLDHTPENCSDDNLRALCQRCHLKHDREHHAASAQATRHARKAIGDLFDAQAHTIPVGKEGG